MSSAKREEMGVKEVKEAFWTIICQAAFEARDGGLGFQEVDKAVFRVLLC